MAFIAAGGEVKPSAIKQKLESAYLAAAETLTERSAVMMEVVQKKL